MAWNLVSGQILLVVSFIFMAMGVVSILLLPDFYSRIVISSKIDVVGFLTCLFGIMMISGFNALTFKVLLIILFEIITAPLATHSIAHSAYASGYRIGPEVEADEEDTGNGS